MSTAEEGPGAARVGRSRLGVIGAGSVGSSMAFAAMLRRSAQEVILYDVDARRAEAEMLDLAHGSPVAGSSWIAAGDIDALAGCDVVIITAGAKQKPGQTRLELAGVNAKITAELMPRLVAQAPNAVYVIVTNPCDVLAVVAQRVTGLPSSQVFGSGTLLDSMRLRWLLAERLGVAPQSVHAMMIGEHGDTEFPLWSQARVGPVPLARWSAVGTEPVTETEFGAIADEVVNAAYKVIAGKGATNYAIALSGARIAEAVLTDERSVHPVSRVLDGYRGLDHIALSVPSVLGANGIEATIDLPYTEQELALLERSADALRTVLRTLPS